MEFMPKDPFSLMSSAGASKTFTTIAGQSSVKVTYELFVSNTAPSGTYELEFRVYTGSQTSNYVTRKVPVTVKGTPDLVLQDISLDKSLEPGDITGLTATIRNVGTGTARRLKLTFTATEELIPVLAKGTIYLGELEAGMSRDAGIELSIDSTAEHKTYTTTLVASYMDEDNMMVEKSFDIGVPVTGSVLLDIVKIEPDYARGKLKVELSNKGTAEIKSLEAMLVINGETVGVEYTSSLKANKKTTLSFPLVTEGTGTLEMSFLGPGTEENTESKPVTLGFEVNGANGTMFLTVVAIIAIIVVAYIFLRRRKKK
jgi:LPXTG-motif cell wall-anchored protein